MRAAVVTFVMAGRRQVPIAAPLPSFQQQLSEVALEECGAGDSSFRATPAINALDLEEAT